MKRNLIDPKLQQHKILFEKSRNIYLEIQNIIIIALNDLFFEDHLSLLEKNPLVIDTMECLKRSNFDMNFLFDLEKMISLFEKEEDFNNNKFFILSKEISEILNDPLIFKGEDNKILLRKINNENLKISKKNLANYMIEKIASKSINVAIEMGCGKSYLTERLFECNKDLIYVGIDKQKDLISNSDLNQQNKKNKKAKNKNKREIIIKNKKAINVIEQDSIRDRSILYDLNIDNNFNSFYEETIKKDLLSKSNIENQSKKVLLFGLHSCGNLSSDSMKIFAEKTNTDFKSLIIISCCLHLVKEFVSEKAKNSELFKDHFSKIGYDSQGNFLDETLVYDLNNENIGYPICNFIKQSYQELFFTRTVRKSAMQSFPENENKKVDMEDFFYKTRFFRSLFQIFLVEFLPELSTYYGYGDVEYDGNENGDFNKFRSYLGMNLKKLKDEKNKIGKKFLSLKLKDYEEILERYAKIIEEENNLKTFYDKFFIKINLLWASYLIKMKFSKIVELIVILDRVIYLLENGIEQVELVEIFDYSKSKRNYLIYANKD
jgi:hypothetical protein